VKEVKIMQKFDNYLIQGSYTISFSGDKALLIGDETKEAEFSSADELMEFLANEGCIGVYKQDGFIKVRFEKDLSDYK
jgi:hypothetical protein